MCINQQVQVASNCCDVHAVSLECGMTVRHSGWVGTCRDAPAPMQPKLLPGPVESINFAQQHAGSFVFGGGGEPSSNGGAAGSATMAMES